MRGTSGGPSRHFRHGLRRRYGSARPTDVPWRNDILMEPLDIARGYVNPPVKPGLGIDINEAEAAKHPFAPKVPMDCFHRDGSVADW
ncbi:MAG: hypothetical protein JNL98_15695 [Bryobacterales bacterium]|nr:hypothetical protein [Bryobacterales bacterium]